MNYGRLGAAAGGWACLAPAAALTVARVTGRDEHRAFVAAQSVTGSGFMLAAVAMGAAGMARCRFLAAASAPVVAVNLRWVLSEVAPARPIPAAADGAPRLRLLSANLFTLNAQMDALAAEILGADADVLLLQELSWANLPGLRRGGVVDAYPFQLLAPRADAFGSAILSRLPLVDEEMWMAAQLPMARGTVLVGGRRVRVYCVHPRAPFGPRGLPRWRAQMISVHQAVSSEPRPLVVAGDFNATWGHRRLRDLLGEGLRDAHVERGRGWVPTWPSDLRFLPPLARVDHVLVSPELAVLAATEGRGPGSDHRPLIVDLALLNSPRPAPAATPAPS
ncbi:MAG: endonuclease/exonuclease/phosphatase family protein [Actinomycetota bacterium]|nr:endonuclease/exonuclease/phosphatase family protein [Actinomycetota bacterium]